MSSVARGGRVKPARASTRGGSRGSLRGGASVEVAGGARPFAKSVRFDLNDAPAAARGSATARGTRGSTRTRATLGRGGHTRALSQTGASSQAPVVRQQSPALGGTGTNYDNRYSVVKLTRERERSDAIRDGFLADPDHPRPLSEAITPVGTCSDMCPEFERLERIVQKDVWTPEMDPATVDLGYGNQEPDEARMVKKFRRSAAGLDEQLPSDLRPPPILQKTVNYLLGDTIDNANSLASVHHFIWDRTRAVRNDFSIQQVNKVVDVRIAMDCYERIARFHILSLHQMARPGRPEANYDYQQDKQQLDKTLFSLMQLYDDSREKYRSPNESEFRSYCILMAIQNYDPYLEDKIQSWPSHVLNSDMLKRSLDLYQAAGEVIDPRGPLKPQQPIPLAQQNWERFWRIVGSSELSYLLSCCAEMVFNTVRKTVLHTLWTSFRVAKSTVQDFTADALMEMLAFDWEDDVYAFCENFGFVFGETDDNVLYLDLNSLQSWQGSSPGLKQQYFSQSLVERKRYGRTLPAVLRGLSVQDAQTAGLMEPFGTYDEGTMEEEDPESLFVPERKQSKTKLHGAAPSFNPAPKFENPFGQPPSTSEAELTGASQQPLNPFAVSQPPAAPANPFAVNPLPTTSTSQPAVSNPFGPSLPASTTLQNPFGPKPVSSTPRVNPFGMHNVNPSPIANPFGPPPASGPIASAQSTASPTVPSASSSIQKSLGNPFQATAAPLSLAARIEQKATVPPVNPFAGAQITGQQALPKASGQSKLFDSSTSPLFASAAIGGQVNGPDQKPTFTFGGLSGDTTRNTPAIGLPVAEPPVAVSAVSANLGATVSSSPLPALPSSTSAPFSFLQAKTTANATPSLFSSFQAPSTSGAAAGGDELATPELRAAPAVTASAPVTTSLGLEKTRDGPVTRSAAPHEPVPKPEVVQSGFAGTAGAQQTGGNVTSQGVFPVAPKQGATFAGPQTTAKPATDTANVGLGKQPPEPRLPWKQRKQQHLIRVASDLFKDPEAGLYKQLMEYLASGIVASEVRSFEKEQREAKLAVLRQNTIVRKWGRLWNRLARVLRLKRQGRERRARVLAAREARAERRSELSSSIGSSQDLEEFRQSMEKDRRSEQAVKMFTESSNLSTSRAAVPTTSIFEPSGRSRSISTNHRRSRTQPTNSLSNATPRNASFRVSKPSSVPKRSLHHAALTASMQTASSSANGSLFRGSVYSPSHKVGTMKSNYFKLKAMGVMIDSDEDDALAHARSVNGKKRGLDDSVDLDTPATKRRVTPAEQPDSESIASKYRHMLDGCSEVAVAAPAAAQQKSAKAAVSDVDNELLARLRNVRETMAESTNWFKTQRERAEERASRSSSIDLHNSHGSDKGPPAMAPPRQSYHQVASSRGASYGDSMRDSFASSTARNVPKFWGRESFFVKREDYGKTKAQREQHKTGCSVSREEPRDRQNESHAENTAQSPVNAQAEAQPVEVQHTEAQPSQSPEQDLQQSQQDQLNFQQELEATKKRLATAAAEALEHKGQDAFVGKGKAPATAALHNPFSLSNGAANGVSKSTVNPFGHGSFGSPTFDTSGSSPFGQLSNHSLFVDPSSLGTSVFGASAFGQQHTDHALSNGFLQEDNNTNEGLLHDSADTFVQRFELQANHDASPESAEHETDTASKHDTLFASAVKVYHDAVTNDEQEDEGATDVEGFEDSNPPHEEAESFSESFSEDSEASRQEEDEQQNFDDEDGYEEEEEDTDEQHNFDDVDGYEDGEEDEEDYRADSAESLPSRSELRMGGNSIEDAIEL